MLRLVCTSIPHLSSWWNWKKTDGSRWTYFGFRVPRLSNRKLESALKCTVWSQCTPVPDRQTNIMAISRRFVLTNASRANKRQSESWRCFVTDTVRKDTRLTWAWTCFSDKLSSHTAGARLYHTVDPEKWNFIVSRFHRHTEKHWETWFLNQVQSLVNAFLLRYYRYT